MRLVFWADRAGAAARVSVPADLQGARSAFSAARSLPGPAVRPCIRRRSAAFQRRRVRPVRAAFCAGSKRCSALRRQPRPMGGACACFGAVCLLRQRRSAPAVLSPCAGRPSGDEVGFSAARSLPGPAVRSCVRRRSAAFSAAPGAACAGDILCRFKAMLRPPAPAASDGRRLCLLRGGLPAQTAPFRTRRVIPLYRPAAELAGQPQRTGHKKVDVA